MWSKTIAIKSYINVAELYSYERRIVCFIDILGFSNLVKGTVNSGIGRNADLRHICGALNMLDDFRLTFSEKMEAKDVRTSQFSDSVVISFPWIEEDNSIVAAISWIKNYQIFLIMEHGVLLRGGITIGDIIHNEKMIVGPAMIDAYTLESKKALNPRIIIDTQVISLFEKAYAEAQSGNLIDAIAGFTQVLERNTHFAEAYFNRGLLHLLLDETDLAIPDLSKAGELGIYQAYNIIKKNQNIKK